jgi:hypothetical protein
LAIAIAEIERQKMDAMTTKATARCNSISKLPRAAHVQPLLQMKTNVRLALLLHDPLLAACSDQENAPMRTFFAR